MMILILCVVGVLFVNGVILFWAYQIYMECRQRDKIGKQEQENFRAWMEETISRYEKTR